MGSASGRRIGRGEIVPRKFERQVASAELLRAACEAMKKEVTTLYPFAAAKDQFGDEAATLFSLDELEVFASSMDRLVPLLAWVRDSEIPKMEPTDLNEGRWFYDPNKPLLQRFTVRGGKACHRNGGYSIALYELHRYFEHDDGTLSDEESDLIGMYNPRTETEDEAVARILPQLEQRLRDTLRMTREDDAMMGNTVPSRELPPKHHFEWTVRYQVLLESYAKIAKADGIREPRTVSEAVRSVGALIGLTLREPSKGGRPRKATPARRGRCIAIRQTPKTPATENGHMQ